MNSFLTKRSLLLRVLLAACESGSLTSIEIRQYGDPSPQNKAARVLEVGVVDHVLPWCRDFRPRRYPSWTSATSCFASGVQAYNSPCAATRRVGRFRDYLRPVQKSRTTQHALQDLSPSFISFFKANSREVCACRGFRTATSLPSVRASRPSRPHLKQLLQTSVPCRTTPGLPERWNCKASSRSGANQAYVHVVQVTGIFGSTSSAKFFEARDIPSSPKSLDGNNYIYIYKQVHSFKLGILGQINI